MRHRLFGFERMEHAVRHPTSATILLRATLLSKRHLRLMPHIHGPRYQRKPEVLLLSFVSCRSLRVSVSRAHKASNGDVHRRLHGIPRGLLLLVGALPTNVETGLE